MEICLVLNPESVDLMISMSHIQLQSSTGEWTPPGLLNNACWAIGELTWALQQEMAPFVSEFVQRAIPLLQESRLLRKVHETLTITLGRVAVACPVGVAPFVSQLFHVR